MTDQPGVEMRTREVASGLDKKLNEHQHEFVIPVEWEYKDWYSQKWGFGNTNSKDNIIVGKRVTVLRCKCGEEWVRSDHE